MPSACCSSWNGSLDALRQDGLPEPGRWPGASWSVREEPRSVGWRLGSPREEGDEAAWQGLA